MAFIIDLKGKIVLVTGVTSGIGKAIAETFAKAGANLVGCARAKEDRSFTALAGRYHVNVIYVSCDVTKEVDLQNLVKQIKSRFDHIDILVSNAGMNVFGKVAECSDEKWQYNHLLNLQSHWKLAQLCKPYLEKSNDAVIIIMTSNHGMATIPGCFPYNVTKTALTGLVRSIAIEWGPAIRTVGIAPGFIDTPGNQQWFDSFPDPGKERQRTIELHPVKKIGTAEEVGAWCVFLASEHSSFASGTTYLLDGGRSALLQDSQDI